jgi:hypothetical protein
MQGFTRHRDPDRRLRDDLAVDGYCWGTVSIVSSRTLMTSWSEGPKGTPNAIRVHFFANAHLDGPLRMRMTILPS